MSLAHTTSRSLGIFGEPRVNVLEVNLELEKTFPARETKEKPPAAEATPAPAVTPPVATAPEAPAPVPERPAAPPVPEAAAPPVVAAPSAPEAAPPVAEVPATTPPPVNPPEKPVSKPVPAGVVSALFPSEISAAHAGEKASVALLKTCSDQYHANAKINANGGLKWNAYWKECKKRLKG